MTADKHEDEARILMAIFFLELVPYEGDEGQRGPPSQAYMAISPELATAAFRDQQQEKPRPRWGWPTSNPMGLRLGAGPSGGRYIIPAHIRLGTHPDR